MTSAQRQVLVANCETADYPIVSVEFPAHVDGHGDSNLKVVTKLDGETYVDFYDTEGRTVSSYTAREGR